MKKCSYCGKEYSEKIVSCPIDGEALIEIIPSKPPDQTAPKTANTYIEIIPWYRKDSTAWTATVLGFFCCAPALWIVGILCLTGDIYCSTRPNGRKWSATSKIIVWILIGVQILIWGLISRYRNKVGVR